MTQDELIEFFKRKPNTPIPAIFVLKEFILKGESETDILNTLDTLTVQGALTNVSTPHTRRS